MQPKRSGNSGRYFSVRNWLSEYGLSLETCGRLCVLVTPRSASKKARLGTHGSAAIGMQRKLPGLNVLFHATLFDEPLGQLRAFAHRHHPAGDVAAEDIQDHVEVE